MVGAHPYRWVVLAAGFTAQVVSSAVFQGLPSIAPTLSAGLDLDAARLGLAIGALNLGLTAALWPWGRLVDRWGERSVMSAGMALCAVGCAMAIVDAGYVTLLVSLALAGVGAASVPAASGSAVLAWFPRRGRGLAMGIRQTAMPVGAALGAFVLPHAAGGDVRSGAFPVLVVASTVVAGIVLVAVRPGPPGPFPGAVGSAVDGDDAQGRSDSRRLVLVACLLTVSQALVLGAAGLFLVDQVGVSAGLAASVLGAAQLVGAALRLLSGPVADRVASRLSLLRIVSLALAVGWVVTAASATVEALAPGTAAQVAAVGCILVLGALSVSWNTVTTTIAAELAGPGRAGRALGRQYTATGLTVTAAPALLIALGSVSWPLVFLVAAGSGSGAARLCRVGAEVGNDR
ncbi:MFS transporter [Nocardioides rubriscoriae]|uniref:MFS transporter n=1 Tax=Nocardioides rubriscoriae TaxID=642762 RepID=UPI0014784D36|nr:MFS transporter [Nocardioides rubriscoriae]